MLLVIVVVVIVMVLVEIHKKVHILIFYIATTLTVFGQNKIVITLNLLSTEWSFNIRYVWEGSF